MILPIFTDPHPVLNQKTAPIEETTPEIQQLVSNMRETMHNAKGVGLAAPQIGKSVALCVIELVDDDPDVAIPFFALINPRVTWKSKKMVSMEEACLSILGIEGTVKRADRVRVKAKNPEGEPIEIEADGYFARVLQHEIDHLNGILFTSYLIKRQLKNREIIEYPRI